MKHFLGLALLVALVTSLACTRAAQLIVNTLDATETPAPTATVAPTATPTPVATPSPAPLAAPAFDAVPLTVEGDSVALDILNTALDAMDGLESVHFTLQAELGMATEGLTATFPFRFEGDYQAPDRMQGNMALSLGFFGLEMEMINIGTDAYLTDPETGLWEKTDGNAVGGVSPTEVIGLSDVEGTMDLSVVGEVTLDNGVSVLHIKGLSTETSGVDGPEQELETNIYIGLDDSLIHQVVVVGNIALDPQAASGIVPGLTIPLGGGDGAASISMITTFSAFNAPVTIEAPIP